MTVARGGSSAGGLSDAKLAARTGRSARDWFEILDAEGATRLSHDQMVALLVEIYEAPEWGAQAVAVRYQREHGIRLPGEQDDGTFTVTASRSIRGAQQAVLDSAVAAVTAWITQDPEEVHRLPERSTAAWSLPGGDRLAARVVAGGVDRCSLTLVRSGIRLPEQVVALKRGLDAVVARVATDLAA